MATILYLTQIQFEFGAIRQLAAECERIGIRRPLVVTDAGVRAAGVLQKALDALVDLPVTVFDQTPPNPTEAAVRAAHAVWQAAGCDGLIAVGGGSSIDLAKGLAIMATHPGSLTPYATIEGGSPKVTAICDPELTLGLPPALTAATGMDAIAHCMETFMAPAFNPPADGIALDGLERAWAHIERATRDGSDREARLNMMSASMQGAMAFQKGLGAVHSLSHSLGGVNPKLHHGTLNAMFLPAVIQFNAGAESIQKERRLARMAHAMGLASEADIPQAIRDMNARLGLPKGLAAMGVQREWFDRIISGAMADHCHKTNPRVATAEEYRDILEASM